MSRLTLSFAFSCGLAAGVAQAQVPALVPPAEAVAGRSQSNWSEVWWQWAWSFSRDESPLSDPTGQRCGSRQTGDVWFLAGTFGTNRTIRTCSVPRGKHLFFPLVNHVVPPPRPGAGNCVAAMTQAAALTDSPSALVLELDGVRVPALEAHRQKGTGCFDLGELTNPRVKVSPAAANGYYVMLRPLPPGTHTLNFGGILGDMAQAVTYTLNVE